MATIKQIDDRTVHRIQSGQVIVDLCSVVKELVENSIDSGATIVDVRFKNQGLDSIEVQDNGSGIAPENYASVALKHHTSKLSSYSDIAELQTFGFRGEALASLCALSYFTIVTCLASDVPKGSKLNFEPSGKLKGTSVVAAQRGTVVTIEKLFHNLPVRRRELERNIKREWHKVISLLNQYACIQTNLKFSVSQQPTKGKRIILFSTKGNASTRDNVMNIFGAKTMTSLVPLDLELEMRPSAVEPAMQELVDSRTGSTGVRVVGHVSRPVGGEGRQTPDRQMFFVNGRPCGLPQFAKTFNEVYRSYNSTQSPFIFADIQLDTRMYDVNVSPDKRTILLHDQARLLESLRGALMSLFDSHEYTVPMSRPLGKQTSIKDSISPSSSTRPADTPNSLWASSLKKASDTTMKHSVESEDEEAEDEEDRSEDESAPAPRPPARRNTSRSLRENGPDQRLITPWTRRTSPSPASTGRPSSPETDDAGPPVSLKSVGIVSAPIASAKNPQVDGKSLPVQDFNARIAEFSAGKSVSRRSASTSPPSSPAPGLISEEQPIPAVKVTTIMPPQPEIRLQARSSPKRSQPQVTTIRIGDLPKAMRVTPLSKRRRTAHSVNDDEIEQEVSANSDSSNDSDEEMSDANPRSSENRDEPSDGHSNTSKLPQKGLLRSGSPSVANIDQSRDIEVVDIVEEDPGSHTLVAEPRALSIQSGHRRKDATLQLAQKLITDEAQIFRHMGSLNKVTPNDSAADATVKQVESIDANDAEAKLALIIERSDFARMRVAGQFNLGFIIATRPARRSEDAGETGEDELFIIDQHASDEKYNFERLQNTTAVQSQPLVHHKRLELTALEEEIIMQNQKAIEANGFKYEMDLDGDAPVGSRCRLTALPLSRETTFDLTDFEELLALLGDESSESSHIPRPSRVRKMFAMRACRSSVMIGRPLTKPQMYMLVKHMGEMDKPWNCPHGRPTMRHLCRLQAWDGKSWNGDTEEMSAAAWQSYGGE